MRVAALDALVANRARSEAAYGRGLAADAQVRPALRAAALRLAALDGGSASAAQ